jgi:hypothetical protein
MAFALFAARGPITAICALRTTFVTKMALPLPLTRRGSFNLRLPRGRFMANPKHDTEFLIKHCQGEDEQDATAYRYDSEPVQGFWCPEAEEDDGKNRD